MARSQGLGSDPGLPLGETSKPPSSGKRKSQVAAPSEEGSDDFDFNLTIDEDPHVPLGGPPSGKTKNTPSSAGKRNTPPSKPSKVNPAAKASDSDVRLVPDNSDMDFELTIDDPPAAKSPVPRPRQSRIAPDTPKSYRDRRLEQPTPGSDSDVKIVPDDSDTDNEAVPLGQSRAKTPSDSDIRMELDEGHPGPKRPGSDPMVTEEIDLDMEELQKGLPKSKPPSSKRSKTQPTKPPSKPLNLPTESPFELSEEDAPAPTSSSKSGKELEDSSSDFELSLDGSDIGSDSDENPKLSLLDSDSDENPKLSLDDEEVSLGELGASAGASGINLEAPADSGISLEADGSDEMEFELSLDDGGSGSTPKPRSGKSAQPEESSEFELSLDDDGGTEAPQGDSDSEFELTLDDSGSSDLALEETDSASDSEFELTLDEDGGLAPVEESSDLADEDNNLFESDFDVPSLDDESASEAVALEDSSSDFDLAVDDSVGLESSDSASQVVPLDESGESDEAAETVNRPARKSKLAPGGEEGEEGLDLDLDASGEAATEDEEEALGEEGEEGVVRTGGPTQYVESPPAEWGFGPALMMLPCVIVLFVVGLMSYELIQGMWGYHKGSKVSSLVVDPLARMFDDTLPKE